MKFVLVSDTHGERYTLPSGDVLVHSGDITHLGSFAEFKEQVKWLKTQPHKHKVFVPGNHDCFAENLMNKNMESQLKEFMGPIHYLRDTGVIIDGVRIWGSPWVLPWAGAFNMPLEEIQQKWDAIPDATNVLVCHSEPERGALQRLTQLKLVVSGHFHEKAGMTRANGITFCNAAGRVYTVDV